MVNDMAYGIILSLVFQEDNKLLQLPPSMEEVIFIIGSLDCASVGGINVCTDTRGIQWVDDSKATNVESTYTGLIGIKDKKAVVLLGGLAKASNGGYSNGFERLIELLDLQRGVITFGFSGEMIYRTLCDGGLSVPCIKALNLVDAVKKAKRIALQGDIILLSPGCASFDEFRNFEHRGQVFQELALFS